MRNARNPNCINLIVFAALLIGVLTTQASTLHAQTATISGKLIDRVCSVEDAYQLQPSTEKRCTLWIESSYACPTGTCKSVFTIYCPNAAVDGRAFNSAYPTCSDPYKLQIRHPTKTYIIQAYLKNDCAAGRWLWTVHRIRVSVLIRARLI